MTRLQRERLDAAVAAILAAGGSDKPGHLADRLRRAMDAGWPESWEVIAQARAWASIIMSDDNAKAMDAARDAIGLLWAVLEDDDWAEEMRSKTEGTEAA